jgi:hypothetical protein
MPIDDAIDYYENLSRKMFKPRKGFGATKFDHGVVERIIKDVVKQHTGDTNAKMYDNREGACKT